MEWLAQNWFWVLLLFAFISMHFFCHGGHRGRKHPHKPNSNSTNENASSDEHHH